MKTTLSFFLFSITLGGVFFFTTMFVSAKEKDTEVSKGFETQFPYICDDFQKWSGEKSQTWNEAEKQIISAINKSCTNSGIINTSTLFSSGEIVFLPQIKNQTLLELSLSIIPQNLEDYELRAQTLDKYRDKIYPSLEKSSTFFARYIRLWWLYHEYTLSMLAGANTQDSEKIRMSFMMLFDETIKKTASPVLKDILTVLNASLRETNFNDEDYTIDMETIYDRAIRDVLGYIQIRDIFARNDAPAFGELISTTKKNWYAQYGAEWKGFVRGSVLLPLAKSQLLNTTYFSSEYLQFVNAYLYFSDLETSSGSGSIDAKNIPEAFKIADKFLSSVQTLQSAPKNVKFQNGYSPIYAPLFKSLFILQKTDNKKVLELIDKYPFLKEERFANFNLQIDENIKFSQQAFSGFNILAPNSLEDTGALDTLIQNMEDKNTINQSWNSKKTLIIISIFFSIICIYAIIRYITTKSNIS